VSAHDNKPSSIDRRTGYDQSGRISALDTHLDAQIRHTGAIDELFRLGHRLSVRFRSQRIEARLHLSPPRHNGFGRHVQYFDAGPEPATDRNCVIERTFGALGEIDRTQNARDADHSIDPPASTTSGPRYDRAGR
jgi:hypothetical protein